MWRNQLRNKQDIGNGGDPTPLPEHVGMDELPEDEISTARPRGRGRPASSSREAQRVSSLAQIATERPIFTLSVAADLLGLHPRTLRIYEEKKLVVPARTEGNRRRYSQNDIPRFQSIRHLTQAGVNLEGVRVILDMADELARLGGDPVAVIDRNLRALATNLPDVDEG